MNSRLGNCFLRDNPSISSTNKSLLDCWHSTYPCKEIYANQHWSILNILYVHCLQPPRFGFLGNPNASVLSPWRLNAVLQPNVPCKLWIGQQTVPHLHLGPRQTQFQASTAHSKLCAMSHGQCFWFPLLQRSGGRTAVWERTLHLDSIWHRSLQSSARLHYYSWNTNL